MTTSSSAANRPPTFLSLTPIPTKDDESKTDGEKDKIIPAGAQEQKTVSSRDPQQAKREGQGAQGRLQETYKMSQAATQDGSSPSETAEKPNFITLLPKEETPEQAQPAADTSQKGKQ